MQVRELQTELIVEQKKSEEYQKGVRRYERRCKELMYQVWSPHIVRPPLLSDVLLVLCCPTLIGSLPTDGGGPEDSAEDAGADRQASDQSQELQETS